MFGTDEREAFYKVVRSRRSVREFLEDEIPDEVLDRILEAGRRSASAANRQPWYFLVAKRSENHPLYGLLRPTFQKAPVVLVGLADRAQAWTRRGDGASYAWVDVAIALTEMILAATAEGLGSCWVAAFDTAAARRILDLPDNIDPVSMVVLGKPVSPLEEQVKDRKPASEIIRRGKWSR